MQKKSPVYPLWKNYHILLLYFIFFGTGLFLRSHISESLSAAEFILQTVDSETREPVACQVYVRTQKGLSQRAGKLPFMYDHFTSPGSVTMNYSPGFYPLEIERGLEYLPVSGHFQLNRTSGDAKTERLTRFTNLSVDGWWSGDLYVSRPIKQIEALMSGSDVHVVPLMEDPKMDTSKNDGAPIWFNRDRVYTPFNYVLDRPGCKVSLLNLSAPLIKLSPRLARKNEDFSSGTENTDSVLNSDKTDSHKVNPEEIIRKEVTLEGIYQLRKKEPEMIVNVLDANSWDIPALAATKMLDAYQLLGPQITRDQLLPQNINWDKFPEVKRDKKINVKRLTPPQTEKRPSDFGFQEGVSAEVRYAGPVGQQRWTEDVYYHLLNTGHKITPSAGSGSGISPNAVGANRVYVFVNAEEYRQQHPEKEGFLEEGAAAAYDWQTWWNAFRYGTVVVTNGPLLRPTVEGCLPGDVLEYEGDGPVTLTLGLTLSTRSSIQYLEIIVNGKVTQSIRFADYVKSGRLPPVEMKESGWLMLRVVEDVTQTYRCAMTAPFYVKINGKPYISRRSAQFFLDWQKEQIKMIQKIEMDEKIRKKWMNFYLFSLKYWTRKVENATAE
ncbi:MAG: hypothetical protein Q4C96_09215 [Planctomycetia bacterium]|nr:hypothetical protein [Planctomycetia bacterium]